jgi:hypothetical protein
MSAVANLAPGLENYYIKIRIFERGHRDVIGGRIAVEVDLVTASGTLDAVFQLAYFNLCSAAKIEICRFAVGGDFWTILRILVDKLAAALIKVDSVAGHGVALTLELIL